MAALYLDRAMALLNLCLMYKSQAPLIAIYKVTLSKVSVDLIDLLWVQIIKQFKWQIVKWFLLN